MDFDSAAEAQELFGAMTPVTMSWALVGCYLGHFALLERTIDETLVKVVGMGPVAFMAINRNLDLSGKVRVLRTLADMVYSQPRTGEPPTEEFHVAKNSTTDTLKQILKQLEERNIIAHSLFGYAANPIPGVSFEVVKASNKLEVKMDHWPVTRFVERISEFERLENGLQRFQTDAEKYGFHRLSRARDIAEMFAD